MELNSKKLERSSKIIYYSISIVLCIFLILLSNKIIGDLDTSTTIPSMESVENSDSKSALESKIKLINQKQEVINSQKNTIEITIKTAKDNYSNEKESFDNWVQTRKTLGSPDKDQEVLNRVKKLDEYNAIQAGWQNQLNVLNLQSDSLNNQMAEYQKVVDNNMQITQKKYDAAYKKYELHVFLIRLLFVFPILLLGIFLYIKFRNHKYWPLPFGFFLFSLYAFFFGLVPYLPSYGGYVRYIVGIILSVGLGYYAIKRIRKYLDEKREELKISTEVRAKNIAIETAEKALDSHICPSCGKDFLMKSWTGIAKATIQDPLAMASCFCRYCGLVLFKNCPSCQTRNFAHLPFCSQCGDKLN